MRTWGISLPRAALRLHGVIHIQHLRCYPPYSSSVFRVPSSVFRVPFSTLHSPLSTLNPPPNPRQRGKSSIPQGYRRFALRSPCSVFRVPFSILPFSFSPFLLFSFSPFLLFFIVHYFLCIFVPSKQSDDYQTISKQVNKWTSKRRYSLVHPSTRSPVHPSTRSPVHFQLSSTLGNPDSRRESFN